MFINLWPDSAERMWMEKDLAKVNATTPVIIFTHDQPECEAKHFINPNGIHTINAEDKFENLTAEIYKDGTKAKGDIVFKIKKDDTNLRLLFTASLIGDDYVYFYAEPSLAGGIQVSSTAAVNIRSGAGKNFDVTGSLPANTPATAFGRSADGTWLQIPEGWVFSTLVKTDGDIQSLPVTAQ